MGLAFVLGRWWSAAKLYDGKLNGVNVANVTRNVNPIVVHDPKQLRIVFFLSTFLCWECCNVNDLF